MYLVLLSPRGGIRSNGIYGPFHLKVDERISCKNYMIYYLFVQINNSESRILPQQGLLQIFLNSFSFEQGIREPIK